MMLDTQRRITKTLPKYLFSVAYQMQEDTWTIINSFFKEKGLVSQQLDSFNTFMSIELKKQIEAQSERGIEAESEAQVLVFFKYLKDSTQQQMILIMKS